MNWGMLVCFFKIEKKGDWITVDYGLEVSSQPKFARIQVEETRKPICRKLPADDSVVIEVVAENLLHTTGDVWKSTILHKHCCCIVSPFLNSRNNGVL